MAARPNTFVSIHDIVVGKLKIRIGRYSYSPENALYCSTALSIASDLITLSEERNPLHYNSLGTLVVDTPESRLW